MYELHVDGTEFMEIDMKIGNFQIQRIFNANTIITCQTNVWVLSTEGFRVLPIELGGTPYILALVGSKAHIYTFDGMSFTESYTDKELIYFYHRETFILLWNKTDLVALYIGTKPEKHILFGDFHWNLGLGPGFILNNNIEQLLFCSNWRCG